MRKVEKAGLFGLVLFLVMGGMAWSQARSLPGDLLTSEEELVSEDEQASEVGEMISGDVSTSDDMLTAGAKRRFKKFGLMRPDKKTLLFWLLRYREARRAKINSDIESKLASADAEGDGTSFSLLNFIQYTPSQRNQGACGNCWVWAGTGIMEIAKTNLDGVKDRFSTQYFDSCMSADYNVCCGGDLTGFAELYDDEGFVIPWANTNASFKDGTRGCDTNHNAPSTTTCGSIGANPTYTILSITPETISTDGGQTTAINNIKNVLNQNRGVWFAFWLGSDSDWDDFFYFWTNQSESELWWTPDAYCNTVVCSQLGGHAVVIVGYNDTDADSSKHYWEVLNSWGTTTKRPNGLFRMPMKMNYDCTLTVPACGNDDGYSFESKQFMTLDAFFTSSTNLTPYKPNNWSDKIVVSNRTGTTTDSATLYTTDTLYVDWAIINNSNKKISKPFHNRLYVDDVLKREGHINTLDANKYVSEKDFNIGKLRAGQHKIKLVVDALEEIAEMIDDNEYTKTITVHAATKE
jgi:hypothetical protein